MYRYSFLQPAMGGYRDEGIGNLWENEDLNKTYPPGNFTLKEPKTLGPTLTSTGWLMTSLCSKTLLKFLSSERLAFTSGKAMLQNTLIPSQ